MNFSHNVELENEDAEVSSSWVTCGHVHTAHPTQAHLAHYRECYISHHLLKYIIQYCT